MKFWDTVYDALLLICLFICFPFVCLLIAFEKLIGIINVIFFSKNKVMKIEERKYIVSASSPYTPFYNFMEKKGWIPIEEYGSKTLFSNELNQNLGTVKIGKKCAVWTLEYFDVD